MTTPIQPKPATVVTGFERDLVALMPHLRTFSRAICGPREIAYDMAQETLLKAWAARDSFTPGTNLKAWLFTILRNELYSWGRRAWREARWDEEKAERLTVPGNAQHWALELDDAARTIRTLPDGQRAALILVAAGGFSYDEAASIVGTPVGTVKSRVARARITLLETFEGVTPLARCTPLRMVGATDELLAQLASLTSPGAAPPNHV